jgi:hypothetical protein
MMNMTIWSALAEPNRLHIVELLREGAFTVGEIADRLQFLDASGLQPRFPSGRGMAFLHEVYRREPGILRPRILGQSSLP